MPTIEADAHTLQEFQQEMEKLPGPRGAGRLSAGPSDKLALDKTNAEAGLAKLALTVIELLRQLLERQAIKRIEAGSLSDQQIEDMGETFLRLEQKMEELKAHFGLRDEDLNLDLGPLGNLV